MQNAFTLDLINNRQPHSDETTRLLIIRVQGQYPLPGMHVRDDDHMYEDTRFVVNGSRVPRRLPVVVPALETMRHSSTVDAQQGWRVQMSYQQVCYCHL